VREQISPYSLPRNRVFYSGKRLSGSTPASVSSSEGLCTFGRSGTDALRACPLNIQPSRAIRFSARWTACRSKKIAPGVDVIGTIQPARTSRSVNRRPRTRKSSACRNIQSIRNAVSSLRGVSNGAIRNLRHVGLAHSCLVFVSPQKIVYGDSGKQGVSARTD
jgi:hypothetical protein